MNTHKILAITLGVVALGVVAAASYHFGYDHGWEKSVKNEQPEYPSVVSMQYSGKLTRNSAHASEPWYLEYYDGQNAARTRLGFEGSALCSRDGETIGCADFGFRPNEVVKITGNMKSDYIAVSNLEVMEAGLPPAASDTFKETQEYGFYGTLTLSGYVEVQRRVCNPGDMCGETVDYVHFVFPRTDNEAIKKFTGSVDGNSFVAGDRVGIGCQRTSQNKITYENDADIGWQVGEIVGSDYTRLMASTQTKPVQLKMTREVYTGGRGAPDCYSHFRNFDVM
jgi:hypothetical protein